MVHWFLNSIYYSGAALVLTLAVSIPAGYALAMMNFRGRRTLLVTTLVVMLIPNTALVLPIFLEMNAVGLAGTPLSVILPYSFYPFGAFLTFIYFSTAIPSSLLSAARLDGCNEWQVFSKVALPLATPVVALVGFFSFVQNWNNYFLPFVMLPLERPLPDPGRPVDAAVLDTGVQPELGGGGFGRRCPRWRWPRSSRSCRCSSSSCSPNASWFPA